MKAKPDISGFVSSKDPTEFLEGGAGDQANRTGTQASQTAVVPPDVTPPVKPEPTVQKLFRLRWDVANALKLGATEASISTGKRVTETEIVEALICKHFKLDS